jgi:geranylgeranyl diphosphate synthase type 3
MDYLIDKENLLSQPVKYYIDMKGKNIRKSIVNIIGLYLGIDQTSIDNIDEMINIVHNSSLVVDDIQDNSLIRRNQLCAHIKYGLPLSINASYLCVFKVLNQLCKSSDIKETTKHKIIENIYYTHIGQGMDIYYTQNQIIPSMYDYDKMMEYKTGMIFYVGLDLLMDKTKNVVIKKQYDALKMCLYNFSLFFQIRDDYINLADSSYWKEKGFCQDFDEQKISYMVTYCTNYQLENYKLINTLLKKPNKTPEDKTQILLLMKKNGLFDIVYDKLVQLREDILKVLNISTIFNFLPFYKFDENNLF